MMFDNLTDIDAFWAARVILSFTKEDLRNIIKTAEYSDPMTNEYILRTLWERRQMVAHHWLAKTDALSDFSVRPFGQGRRINLPRFNGRTRPCFDRLLRVHVPSKRKGLQVAKNDSRQS
jgi:hypothetical protein